MKVFPLADHFVHLDETLGRVRVLNQVATSMLALAQEGLSAEAIADAVARDYEVDLATATEDVQHFVQELHSLDATLLEELHVLDGYEPIADFQPLRVVEPVETFQLNLPGYRITVSSEVIGLCDLLSAMFKLSPSVVMPVHSLSLNVYGEGERYPIVAEGKTLDTGLTLADTAVKCLLEIKGMVARSQDWSIIFHASAVAKGNAAVLMPALGGSGKSTLAAYLMHRGFAYLNDDTIYMSAHSSELLPIPVSLAIKSGSWPPLTEYFPGLQDNQHFGSEERRIKYLPPNDEQVQLRPVPCRLLIIPEYDESQQETEVVRLSEVDVFGKIIQSGCFIEQPVRPAILEALVSWLDGLPCYKMTYSSLEGLETVVSDLLDGMCGNLKHASSQDLTPSGRIPACTASDPGSG